MTILDTEQLFFFSSLVPNIMKTKILQCSILISIIHSKSKCFLTPILYCPIKLIFIAKEERECKMFKKKIERTYFAN